MSSTNGRKSGPNEVLVGEESQREVLTSRNKDFTNSGRFDSQESLILSRRKVKSELKKKWSEDIARNNFERCLIPSCDSIIESHYKVCDENPVYTQNLCSKCGKCLSSDEELLHHKSVCEEMSESEVIKDLNQTIVRHWENQLKNSGEASCGHKNCNFIGMKIEDLKEHIRGCNGVPRMRKFCCFSCRSRFQNDEDCEKHKQKCKTDRRDRNIHQGASMAKKSDEENDEGLKNDRNVEKRGRKRRANGEKPEKILNTVEKGETDVKKEEDVQLPKKRGRKPKKQGEPSSSCSSPSEIVKCGKCEFEGTKKSFEMHNVKKHVGLGWIEGETPVNMEDEKAMIKLVKAAFKITKKGVCENCQNVKRSFLGFVSHVQNCGKSAEEKHAMRVQCPHCPGKYLKYSLPVHIKLSHSVGEEPGGKAVEKAEGGAVGVKSPPPSGKRLSALKAVSKFQETLSETEEPEPPVEAKYFLYEKDFNQKLPKLNCKLLNLWYKLKREKKGIPCRHGDCKMVSDDVKEARLHHYACSFLPKKTFMCEACDFYSVGEATIKSHVITHRKIVKERKVSSEEKNSAGEPEEEESEGDEEDEGEWAKGENPKKRKRKKDGKEGKPRRKKSLGGTQALEVEEEASHRMNFLRRENLEKTQGFESYSNWLGMTLEEEMEELEASESWPQLHTTLDDWCHVPPEAAVLHFPELSESMSFGTPKTKWKRLKRFESDLIEDTPVMFTGGSVRALSWCRVSFRRMTNATTRQFLAVSTAQNFEHFKDVHERVPDSGSTLLQIWDCGPLENALAKEAPRFALGIIHGEAGIWDLSWFPEDTSGEESKEWLSRLGLLATASQDGAVRIWSVCHPSQLVNKTGLPIYKTEPVAKLITEDTLEESCFRVSVGRGGIVAGGYTNGTLAVWNLKNVSSPFCKKTGKCRIIKAHRVIQAHRGLITAMAFCPGKSRYLSTAGLDRLVKLWDLESPWVPTEQSTRELCLDMVWAKNWPLLIYSFDEVLPNGNKASIKFVKDILWDKHQSSFSMENICLGLSFSDWLNVLCVSSNTGEIKVRFMRNFIADQKKTQCTLSSLTLKNTEKMTEKIEKVRGTYKEVAEAFGLFFRDNLGVDKAKGKQEFDPEETPVRAVNKVAFNPNWKSFTHLASGYNCGLVRIQCLKELHSNRSLNSFLEKTSRVSS